MAEHFGRGHHDRYTYRVCGELMLIFILFAVRLFLVSFLIQIGGPSDAANVEIAKQFERVTCMIQLHKQQHLISAAAL